MLDDLLGEFFEDLDPSGLLADVGLAEEVADDDERLMGREAEEWLVTAADYERGCRLVEEREARAQGERVLRTTRTPRRSRAARLLVLSRSQGYCENPHCTGRPADVTGRERPILEVDHVRDLALGAATTPARWWPSARTATRSRPVEAPAGRCARPCWRWR
ncbi:hypothetical protein [Streptomyces brasiliensis]|uniref:Uncharacterized protein n=1 Tax=Streptomyces brasiliensis TaxID=1954 RepID=A0A917LBT9_9ACTN|nr:hypothetical protein [Streptomyces brasiliensis]GGJ51875.1 hypothetical protein GCM10010121_073510 [Streptomyces brasiliensis]